MNVVLENDCDEIVSANLDWSYFSGKKILVTGASGMLASYVVAVLLRLNTKKILNEPLEVIGFVRDIEYARKKFSYINTNDFRLIQQDLNDDIKTSLNIDVIIHTASQASPKYYGVDPVGTMLPNIIGTNNLLELARKKDVEKFLFFSSGEVYGVQDGANKNIKEDSYGKIDPLNVRSCYAVSKIAGETMCISYGHQYNLDVKIVRPFHTYGPGMRLDDGRVFADFVKNIVNNENIVMKSDGLQKRPFCYIADAVVGFFFALLNGESHAAYNVANPYQNVSINELANTLIELFPDKKLKVIMQDTTQRSYLRSEIEEQLPDITKLKGLGWLPIIDIADGFERTIRSYL